MHTTTFNVVLRLVAVWASVCLKFTTSASEGILQRPCTMTDVSIYEHEGKFHCDATRCWEIGMVNPFLKRTYDLQAQTVTCWITGNVKKLKCFKNNRIGMMIENEGLDATTDRPWCHIEASKAIGLHRVFVPVNVSSTIHTASAAPLLEYSCKMGYSPRWRTLLDPTQIKSACYRIYGTKQRFSWTWKGDNVYRCHQKQDDSVYAIKMVLDTSDPQRFCTEADYNSPMEDRVEGLDSRTVLYDAINDRCAPLLQSSLASDQNREIYVRNENVIQMCESSINSIGHTFRFRYMNCSDPGDWTNACACDCEGDDDDRVYGHDPVYVPTGETCTVYYICPHQNAFNVSGHRMNTTKIDKGIKVCYGIEKKVIDVETCSSKSDFCHSVPNQEMYSGKWHSDLMRWTCVDGVMDRNGKPATPRGELHCDPSKRQWTFPKCDIQLCSDIKPHYVYGVVSLDADRRAMGKVNKTALCGKDDVDLSVSTVSCVNGLWGPELMSHQDCCVKSTTPANGATPFISSRCGTPLPVEGEGHRDDNGCIVNCTSTPLFYPSTPNATCTFTKCELNQTHITFMCANKFCVMVKTQIWYTIKVVSTLTYVLGPEGGRYIVAVDIINGNKTTYDFYRQWYVMYRKIMREDGSWLYHSNPAIQDEPWWSYPKMNASKPDAPTCGVDNGRVKFDAYTNTFILERIVTCDGMDFAVECDGWGHLQLMNEIGDVKGNDEVFVVPAICAELKKNIIEKYCNSSSTVQPPVCPSCDCPNNVDCPICNCSAHTVQWNNVTTIQQTNVTTTVNKSVSEFINQTIVLDRRCVQCGENCAEGITNEMRNSSCAKKFPMSLVLQGSCLELSINFCKDNDCSDCLRILKNVTTTLPPT